MTPVESMLTAALRAAEQRTRLERVKALEEQISVLRAQQVRLLADYAEVAAAAVDGPAELVDPIDGAAEELAVALTWTAYRAETALDEATALVTRLPATLAALADGRVDYPRAQTVVRALVDLDDEQARAVDVAVAPMLPGSTTAQLRDRCEREVLAVDADAARRRHRRRTGERRVGLRGAGDGMAVLSVSGPAAALLGGYDALTARARGARRDDPHRRTLDQLRFDLLVAGLGVGGRNTSDVTVPAVPAPVPAAPSPAALVGVTIAASTLLGYDENPGELAGHGPVPADVARALALHPDSRLRRLVVDDRTGALLPTGAAGCPHDGSAAVDPGSGRGYRPGAALARYVRARDPRCTAPGCRAPAYRCDLDHVVAWPQGPTCACNLHPLCRRHHRVKHEAGWVPKRHQDGSTTWTTTNGVEVTSPAQAVLATPSVVAPPEQPAAGAERDDPGVDPDPDLAADPEPYRLRALRARMARQVRRRGDLGPPPF